MGVRKESVELSLNDVSFTTGMAKAAAQTAILNHELDRVDGTSVKANRSTSQLADQGLKRTGSSARSSSDDLNKYTGRMNALVQASLTLGPALVPLTSGLLPAVTGVAAGVGAAAGAVGVAVLAFHGMGDALTALNTYHLQPTAAHLQALNDKMSALGPSGQSFARFLSDLAPDLTALQESAQSGLFPGMREGITALLPLLPQVERLVNSIASEMGNLTAKAGHGLATDSEFQAFFHYLQTDAAPTLDAFAKATGNVAAGLAQMTVDFAPVNRDFADGLVHASESFRKWTDGLAQTQGFHEFVTYIETEGPRAVALLESLGKAALGIAEAAQPVGDVVLPVLTALLNVIGAIGKSPLGPVIYTGVAATIAFNKGAELMSGLLTRLTGQTAALSLEMRGLAASAGAADVALAGGGAAGVAKITGLGSLLAASPVVRGLPGKAAGAASTSMTAALIAYLAGSTANAGFNAIAPKPGTFDINSIVGSINKSTGFKGSLLADPARLIGFNPDHLGDKGPYQRADQGLAQLVASGQGDQAAAIFAKINAQVKDAAKYFPQYTSAVTAAGGATGIAATKAQANAQAQMQQAASLNAATDAALGAFDAETQYRQALNAALDQAKKSNAGFKGNSAEVLANRQALSGLAGAWKTQIQAMAENGASADKIRAKYRSARAELIATATGMGATAAEARRYANQLLQIPKTVSTQVNADTAAALASIRALRGYLNDIPRNVHVNVTASTNANLADISGINGPRHKAAGGPIYGPGTSTSDSIPAYLSNGEYVMRAAAVAKYGPAMFDSLNAMHFAGGGPVRSSTDPTSGQKTYYLPFGSKAPWAEAEKYTQAAKAVDRLTKALDKLTKQSDALSKAQQQAQSNYDSLTSTVSANLTSGDLFGSNSSGSVFAQQYAAGSIGSVNAKLTQQIQDANDQTQLEQSLSGRGLSGAALQALIEQGGITGLRSFSNASDADLAQYQSLYGQRATAVGTASSTAADVTGLTQQLAEANASLAAIQAAVTHTTNQQTRAQKQVTRAKEKLNAKQAKQTGQAVTHALNHQARRSRNR